MKILRVTPVLVADRIEPLLSCWRDALGYELLSSTTDAGGLGRALLRRDSTHVLLLSHRTLSAEAPTLMEGGPPPSMVCLEVASLDEVLRRMPAHDLIAPPRVNVVGQREAFFRDRAGHVVMVVEPR